MDFLQKVRQLIEKIDLANRFDTRLVFKVATFIWFVISFLSRIFYDLWVGFSVSMIFAHITAILIVILFLGRFGISFFDMKKIDSRLLIFLFLNFVAIFQIWFVSLAFAYYILPGAGMVYFAREISHAVGISVPLLSWYIASRYISFEQ